MWFTLNVNTIPIADLNHVDDNARQSTIISGLPLSLEPLELSTIPSNTNVEATFADEVKHVDNDGGNHESPSETEQGETIFDVKEEEQILISSPTPAVKTTTSTDEKGTATTCFWILVLPHLWSEDLTPVFEI